MKHVRPMMMLRQCADHCSDTLYHYCLVQGGAHSEATHVKQMIDCIEVCNLTAEFIARGARHHRELCGVCAEICHGCADSCAAIDDKRMRDCAEICRRVAKSCEDMAYSNRTAA